MLEWIGKDAQEGWLFAGERYQPELAQLIAEGKVNPLTLEHYLH